MQNSPQTALFDLLVTRDFEPELLDSTGKAVNNPGDAELFSFDWKTANKNYGTVVILIGKDQDLQVFFGDNLGRTMEATDKKDWYSFLEQVKNFAVRNLLNFQIKDLAKLKYTMQGMAAIKEGLFEGYYGNKKYSYSDQPKQVKLVIKHSRPLGESDKRYRNIESLFVETADGERFKVPSRSTMHGKMLARHVSEGGNPYDAFGCHINEIMSEMATLSKFVRAAKHKNYSGQAGKLSETAVRHYNDLKAKAKRMISQRGYHRELEEYDPAAISKSDQLTDSIRNMFIEQSLDPRIEEAMPVLARLSANGMKESDEFESWADDVTEGSWALPDTRVEADKLKELMAEPLVVGADATNAIEQLYDLVGDDELFDILSDIAEENPDTNIWDNERVIARLGELGIEVDTTQPSNSDEPNDEPTSEPNDEQPTPDMPDADFPEPTSENLDTDGVMMTKPSNMSSESVERILKLAQLLR